MSAYMLWLNSSRERIKSENPGISITEISKKAGEMWRQLGKDEKEVREKRGTKKFTLLLSQTKPGASCFTHFKFICSSASCRNGKQRQERLSGSMIKQRKNTKRVVGEWPPAPRSKLQQKNFKSCFFLHGVFLTSRLKPPTFTFRESKKSVGKKDEKKRKSAVADKDRERGGGNDSFKSREFIETSEESSSDSDRKSKSKSKSKRKKVMIDKCLLQTGCRWFLMRFSVYVWSQNK